MERFPHGIAIRRIFKITALGFLFLPLWPAWLAAQSETAVSCDASDPNQVRLQIGVSGMHSSAGNITISIYPDEPSHFLDGKYKLGRQYVPITLPVTHACFGFAKPGYYAVALNHDENGNHHFDTTMLGLPAEGYGFSNNPTLYFGPPSLGKVRFEAHPGDNPVAIRMKYF